MNRKLSTRARVVQIGSEQIGAVASLRNVVIVDRLPKTRSGKILRRLCEVLLMAKFCNSASTIDDEAI
jgi:propionyl-CoA synthetase